MKPSNMQLPQVVIDARMVALIPHGIARYVIQISKGLRLAHLEKALPYEPVFLIDSRLPQLQRNQFQPFTVHEADIPFLSLREIFQLKKTLEILNASLYHSPSFSSLLNCPCPSIVTLHDLNHLTYGGVFKKIYYQTLLRRFAQRSEVITTVSKFSQDEISEWLNYPKNKKDKKDKKDKKNKIEIAYNAIEPLSKPTDPLLDEVSLLKEFNLRSGQYFFCLSNSKPHKNLKLLIQAYSSYQSHVEKPCPLVLTTKGMTSAASVLEIGSVSEDQVKVLLNHSIGVLFPSLYEGFGLPPLEAAIGGKRIAVSKIPPHQEGLADLKAEEVLWVEPQDLLGWTQAFHKMQNSEFPCPSPESQLRLLSRFSAETLGQHMDQIYRRVLKL